MKKNRGLMDLGEIDALDESGVPYWFSNDVYSRHVEMHDPEYTTRIGCGAVMSNLNYISIVDVENFKLDITTIELLRLSQAPAWKDKRDAAGDDFSEHSDKLGEFMRQGPVSFANRMKAWPGSRSFELYKLMGDAWFDTMIERAKLAANYLSHESNPVKREPVAHKSTNNVIKVQFGGRK